MPGADRGPTTRWALREHLQLHIQERGVEAFVLTTRSEHYEITPRLTGCFVPAIRPGESTGGCEPAQRNIP